MISKKVILVLLILLLSGCEKPDSYKFLEESYRVKTEFKYRVVENEGFIYYTDSYKIKGRCVYFNNSKSKETVLCGNILIEEQ